MQDIVRSAGEGVKSRCSEERRYGGWAASLDLECGIAVRNRPTIPQLQDEIVSHWAIFRQVYQLCPSLPSRRPYIAALCLRVAQGWNLSVYLRKKPSTPTGKTAVAGCILLAYAILLFIHFYRSSGGASSVGIVDGQYVYLSKTVVIRPISEEEYIMFPTQVARIMSAWMGMMATFCLSSFIRASSSVSCKPDSE